MAERIEAFVRPVRFSNSGAGHVSDTLKNKNGAGLNVGTAKEELLANGWRAWMW